MSDEPRTPWAAVVSLLLGVSSVIFCLGALTAVPAFWLGLSSLRAINTSDGQLRGGRIAVAGLLFASLGLLLTLLGVGAIIALQLRATSQRAQCQNNLRVLGLGLQKYEGLVGSLPAATLGPPTLPPQRRVSWMAGLLPLLADNTRAGKGMAELGASIDLGQPWDAEANQQALHTPVRYFLCPAHPTVSRRTRPAATTYVGLAGVGLDSASAKRAEALAGVFGYDRGVKYTEATGGISSTLMVLETAQDNGAWLAGGPPTVRGLEEGVAAYLGLDRPFGGLHPEVTMGLWMDGSARPLNDNVPGEVLRQLVPLKREHP